MAEESLGRAVAALAPIAERMADQRERAEGKERKERELAQRLEKALVAAPPLERPSKPPIDSPYLRWRWPIGEMLVTWLVTAGFATLFLLPIFLIWIGNWIVPLALGLLVGTLPQLRELPDDLQHHNLKLELERAVESYERALRAFNERQAERAAIRAAFDEPATGSTEV